MRLSQIPHTLLKEKPVGVILWTLKRPDKTEKENKPCTVDT